VSEGTTFAKKRRRKRRKRSAQRARLKNVQ
jgi:hypothetical protein